MLQVFAFNVKVIFVNHAINLYMKKKKNSQHVKENVDPYIPIDIKCPDHPQIVNNLFCVNENGKFN